MVGEAAGRVGDAGHGGRRNAGATDLTPSAASRGGIHRDSAIGIGVRSPIRRAAVRSGDVADQELVIGLRFVLADATAAVAPAVLNSWNWPLLRMTVVPPAETTFGDTLG